MYPREEVKAFRFGVFEVDGQGDLLRNGTRIRLPEKAFQLLLVLLENAGEIVYRDEIQSRLWPNQTVVDFEHGINTAIRRLRAALGDTAEQPRFVETIPRRGYRFIAPVDVNTRIAERIPKSDSKPRLDSEGLTGKQISHFRILEKIGSGGMGVVYRAEDTLLGRQVAVKMLARELADDPAAVSRLRQEARANSSLHHPGICDLYEICVDPECVFLVMPLLRGRTLRSAIAEGPFDLRAAARLCMQVAVALEHAHAAGIVHRDIKPENLFLTAGDQVKILDFGIASADATTPSDLQPGRKAGTAAYMAPEQRAGELADARADIWALGAVLFELLTSRQFSACDPENALAPLAARPALRKALARRPEDRYQNAAQFGAALGSLAGAGRVARFSKWRLATAGLVVAGAAGLLAGLRADRFAPESGPTVTQVRQLTSAGHVEIGERLVSDGNRVYFVRRNGGHWGLAQVSGLGGDPVPVPTPFVNTGLLGASPDRATLLVTNVSGDDQDLAIWLMSVPSGALRRLGQVTGRAAGWSPRGDRIAYVRGNQLSIVTTEGTGDHPIAQLPQPANDIRWSPDGRILRLTLYDLKTKSQSIWQLNSDGSDLHVWAQPDLAHSGFAEGYSAGSWTPDGRYFFWTRNDGRSFELYAARDATSLPSHVYGLHRWPMISGPPILSPRGDMAMETALEGHRELARYDAGLGLFVSKPFGSDVGTGGVTFSPDGGLVAFANSPGSELVVSRPDGSGARQLTYPPLRVSTPRWSPDGQWIAFGGTLPGQGQSVYRIRPAGGEPEKLTGGDGSFEYPGWLDRDALVVFHSPAYDLRKGTSKKLDLRTHEMTPLPGLDDWLVQPSPDGKYLACISRDNHRFALYSVGTGKMETLREGQLMFGSSWSTDSKTLYFQDLYAGVDSPIYRASVPDGRVRTVELQKNLGSNSLTGYSLAGVTPDGLPLVVMIRANSELYAFDLKFR